jgi:hypothetical protein
MVIQIQRTAGNGITAGYRKYHTHNLQIPYLCHYGYGVCGYGYGVENPDLWYTRDEPYMLDAVSIQIFGMLIKAYEPEL